MWRFNIPASDDLLSDLMKLWVFTLYHWSVSASTSAQYESLYSLYTQSDWQHSLVSLYTESSSYHFGVQSPHTYSKKASDPPLASDDGRKSPSFGKVDKYVSNARTSDSTVDHSGLVTSDYPSRVNREGGKSTNVIDKPWESSSSFGRVSESEQLDLDGKMAQEEKVDESSSQKDIRDRHDKNVNNNVVQNASTDNNASAINNNFTEKTDIPETSHCLTDVTSQSHTSSHSQQEPVLMDTDRASSTPERDVSDAVLPEASSVTMSGIQPSFYSVIPEQLSLMSTLSSSVQAMHVASNAQGQIADVESTTIDIVSESFTSESTLGNHVDRER